ncbi:hypothetical protein BD779DRAFT_1472720 [Infundibulicybe gibba]|nr:hypothetical protein BD779DRAFT_1472720 [Infundibulicybe gibba]
MSVNCAACAGLGCAARWFWGQRVYLQLFLKSVWRSRIAQNLTYPTSEIVDENGKTHATHDNFMSTQNTYVALPLDSPTSTDYPPTSPLIRSQSPGVVAVSKTKWRPTFSRTREIIESNTGLLLVAASQALASLVHLIVKKLHSIDPPISTMQRWTAYRCSHGELFTVITGVPDPFLGPKSVRVLLFCRVSLAIAGSLLLNEKFSIREAFAGVFSLFGVILIARPAFLFGSSTLAGDIDRVGWGSGGTGACLPDISIRAAGTRAHPLHCLISYSVQSTIISTTYMTATKSPFIIPTRLDWLGLLILIGIFGFIVQRETAGRGTLGFYTQVWKYPCGVCDHFRTGIPQTIPSALSICGTLIIVTSALYVVLTKKSKSSNAVSPDQLDEQVLEEGLLESRDNEHRESTLEDKHPTARNSIELHSIRV